MIGEAIVPAHLPPAAAPVRAGGLVLVDQLLRDRAGVLARVRQGLGLSELVKTLVITIVVGAALAGAAMGSFRGGAQIAFAAVKLPLALLLTAALCAPALAALGHALGRPASLARDLALVVTALATGTLVLVALVPVLLVARAVDLDYHGSILLTVGCGGVAGVVAVAVLVVGLRRVSLRDVSIVVTLFSLLFVVVGAQVGWTLRPWLVRPRATEIPFVRGVEGSLYDAVLGSATLGAGRLPPRSGAAAAVAGGAGDLRMTVVELAVGYAGVGALLALVAVVSRRAGPLDALLLLGLWPLYGPVLIGGGGGGDPVAPDPREEALVLALRQATAMPLAVALPDEARARSLTRRIRDGRARLAELDRVLARPDLDEAAARSPRRIDTIRRLREVRARFAADLDHVDELVTQLTVQLELVRFGGGADDDTAAELAADLSVPRRWPRRPSEPLGERSTMTLGVRGLEGGREVCLARRRSHVPFNAPRPLGNSAGAAPVALS